jgi:hypothetical protein
MESKNTTEQVEYALKYIADIWEDIQFRQCGSSMRLFIGKYWAPVNGSYADAIVDLARAIEDDK